MSTAHNIEAVLIRRSKNFIMLRRTLSDMAQLAEKKTRVYLFVAEDDSYYGSEPARNAWNELHDIYLNSGLDEDEITDLLVQDVRPDSWFDKEMKNRADSMYATDYHGAGMLVAYDENVMKWVFE